MKLLKTQKDSFTNDEILKAIAEYERNTVPELNDLWEYYKGANPKITARKPPDSNNPNNIIPVPYGRKIVTTFTGYAYRPRYITYKPNIKNAVDIEEMEDETGEKIIAPEESFMEELQKTFNLNNEHIKTSRSGRNMSIFGVAYELMYIDAVFSPQAGVPLKAEPKFFNVDPRKLILYYDFSAEPKKKFAIYFYMIEPNWYKAVVYYRDRILQYDRKRDDNHTEWALKLESEYPNFFDDVPVVAYYFGDDMLGVIRPVVPLIDANDILFSDSFNEFEKFSFAIMLMKKFGLTDPTKKKEPGMLSMALKLLKQRRIIEHIPEDATISYLTKDIPTAFIQYMAQQLRSQIHVQSHVPDFSDDRMAGASGIAIQRLLFDFENMVSSTEADFDLGLLERIRLINVIYSKTGKVTGTFDMVTISHKRNIPLNLMEFAQTALTMKSAEFSSYLVADIMPDDIIPDVKVELARQKKEAEALMPDMSQYEMLGQQAEEQPMEEEVAPEGNIE
jgi:SPP1 family phage portal protein